MKQCWILRSIIYIVVVSVVHCGCQQTTGEPKSIYKYIEPTYGNIQLATTRDTLSFQLDDTTYNAIKSFNLFLHKGTEYISFYDQRSETINVYNFETKKLKGKISMKNWFKGHSLYKTSTYVKNFDSIYVTNLNTLYLFDRHGKKKWGIDFPGKTDVARAFFDNTCQPVFKDGQLFAAVSPGVDYNSLEKMKKWKVLYQFGGENNKARLHIDLPDIYWHNLYGSQFIKYNFCFNNQGHFVFSFPADTNIYVTDLKDYYVAYYAKSRFQKEAIAPLKKDQLQDDIAFKQYKLRDSYGPIFFDPYKKRHLRLAKQKFREEDYKTNEQDRKQTVIIFDEKMHIIGESALPDGLSFSSLIFSANNSMYARVNGADENALHFVRLEYKELPDNSLHQLTKLGK